MNEKKLMQWLEESR